MTAPWTWRFPATDKAVSIHFDAVRVKIRDEGLVKNKAVYLAIGYTCSGYKQILGMWIEQTEGAKFWLSVMNDLKGRGLDDVLIAVVDGLSGFPDAIEAAYPQALVQICIVHLIRNSMAYASWKERKAIYTTNAIESLNSTVRRAVRSKGYFPHDDAAKKLIYLALRGVAAKWKRPPQYWSRVKAEFAVRFEERFKLETE